MNKSLLSAAGGLLLLVSGAVLAQNAPAPAGSGVSLQGVEKRQAAEQARIAQGQAAGTLTPGEANRLAHGQGHIDNAERKAQADGVVTRAESRHIVKLEDRQSKRIFRRKHDADHSQPQ